MAEGMQKFPLDLAPRATEEIPQKFNNLLFSSLNFDFIL
jgi:hypothetical protein